MNSNETTDRVQEQAVPAAAPRRETMIHETVFAWIAIAAAYIYCRMFPAYSRPLGAFLLIIGMYVAGGIFMRISGKTRQNRRSVFTVASAMLFSLSFLLSSNGLIHFLAFAWAVGFFFLWIMFSFGGGLEARAGGLLFYDVLKATVVMPFASFGAAFSSLLPLRKKDGTPQRCGRQVGFAALGLFAAIIPTAIVIVLLSYDEAFGSIGAKIGKFLSDDILDRAVALLFAIPISAYGFGAFISGIDRKNEKYMSSDSCRKFSDSAKFAPETTACFALLPLLIVYTVFFISQWNYYVSAFSGRLPEGVEIYSKYAREGFGELCAVSGINAAVMLVISAFTKRRNSDRHSPVMRVFIGLLAVSTLILVATALSKMALYINAYGLTRLRVYASWFMILIAAGFLIALIKEIAPRFNAVCALLAVFVLLFGALALSDPDRIIAEYNVDRYIAGTLGLDVETLSNEYSDSAIPALVRLRTALEDRPDTENFKKIIDHRLDVWQRTNGDPAKNIFCETLPRIRARRAVQGMLTED